jgi:hypothetical protein
MEDENSILPPPKRMPWNKGKLIGAKPPLLARHVWSIRTKLQIEKVVCGAGQPIAGGGPQPFRRNRRPRRLVKGKRRS